LTDKIIAVVENKKELAGKALDIAKENLK